jgi:hypothetical protein
MWTNVVDSGFTIHLSTPLKESIRPWNFGNKRYPEIDTTFSLSQARERETKASHAKSVMV